MADKIYLAQFPQLVTLPMGHWDVQEPNSEISYGNINAPQTLTIQPAPNGFDIRVRDTDTARDLAGKMLFVEGADMLGQFEVLIFESGGDAVAPPPEPAPDPVLVETPRYIPRTGTKKMADYIPKADREALAAVSASTNYIEANAAALGVSAADAAALVANRDDFSVKLNDSDAKKIALATSVWLKDASRATMENLYRNVVQRVQLNPDVTDAMRVAAGIPVRDTIRTIDAPVVVGPLVAVPNAAGYNDLDWTPGQNTAGIRYVVEFKPAGAAEWSLADVVTATKYRHQNNAPGARVAYRVKARRGVALGPASNVVEVYATFAA